MIAQMHRHRGTVVGDRTKSSATFSSLDDAQNLAVAINVTSGLLQAMCRPAAPRSACLLVQQPA